MVRRNWRRMPDINDFEVRLLITEDAEIVRTAESASQQVGGVGGAGCEWGAAAEGDPRPRQPRARPAEAHVADRTDGRVREVDADLGGGAPGFESRNVKRCGNVGFQACARSDRASIPRELLQRIRRENPGSYVLWTAARALFAAQERALGAG